MDPGAIEFNIPTEKPYVVVELTLEDGRIFSAAVACAWLRDVFLVPRSADDDTYIKMAKTCFYPNDGKAAIHLQTKKKPLPTWDTYSDVRIVALCIGQAKDKVESAMDKTDVSESDSAIPSKRSKKAVSRYLPESSKNVSRQQHKRSHPETNENDADSDGSSDPGVSAPKLQLSRRLLSSTRPSGKKSSLRDADEDNGNRSGQSKTPESPKSGLRIQSASKPSNEGSQMLYLGKVNEDSQAKIGQSEVSDILMSSKSGGSKSSKASSPIQHLREDIGNSGANKGRDKPQQRRSDLLSDQRKESESHTSPIPRGSTKPSSNGYLSSDSDNENPLETRASKSPSVTLQHSSSFDNDWQDLESQDPSPSVSRTLHFDDRTPKSFCKKKTPTKGIRSEPRFKSPGKRFSPQKYNNSGGAYYRTIQTQLSDIRKRIDGLHLIVNRLVRNLSGNIEGPTVEHEGEKVSMLPLNSFDDMKEFEKYLGDNDHMLDMVTYLSDYGTSTCLKDSVYALLKKLLTNTLASQMNFLGTVRRGCAAPKKKFCSSPGYTLIMAALKKHCKELSRRKLDSKHFFDESIISSQISNWLSNAPKRVKNVEGKSGEASDDDHVDDN